MLKLNYRVKAKVKRRDTYFSLKILLYLEVFGYSPDVATHQICFKLTVRCYLYIVVFAQLIHSLCIFLQFL